MQQNRTRQSQRRSLTTSTRHCVDLQHDVASTLWPINRVDDGQRLSEGAKSLVNSVQLPRTCPGCGALTQELEASSPGFYSRSRRAVKIYLRIRKRNMLASNKATPAELLHEEMPEEEERMAKVESPEEDGDTTEQAMDQAAASKPLSVPLCDRCHELIHDSKGQSIAHPSIDNIADSIAESPFKRNHIYHVIDAADFPMSVIPSIFSKLELAKTRSRNRRSQHDFSSRPTISFIITRSDLLGSTKEMVDAMMPYFQSVLRKALGRTGKEMRLGNIHLVSAKRGWWTKEIKEEIWKRGGANWMVGKFNVGKSNLFEVLFPRGSGERAPVYAELQEKQKQGDGTESTDLDENSLLPPAQPEVPFPVFPVVSSLPGTTASPIRLPFGNHRGELIDLPGLERGDLEKFVQSDDRLDLVMTHRLNVEQHIVKPGQSLILGGGLIRITPQLDQADKSTTMLAYPFVPLKAHVTSTEKAILQQLQQRESGIASILAADAGTHMQSAGHIELSTNITKSRAGALLRSGVDPSKLPFSVYATDVLVEGLGWIELVCQVRKRSTAQPHIRVVAQDDSVSDNKAASSLDEAAQVDSNGFAPFGSHVEREESKLSLPSVEVFSPNGRHVSSRPCLEVWRRWTEGRRRKDISNNARTKKYMNRSRS